MRLLRLVERCHLHCVAIFMDTASIFIGFRVSEIDRLETNRAQQWVIHTGPHTPARLLTSTEYRLSLNGIKFQRRHPEGPRFHQRGEGSRAILPCTAHEVPHSA